MPVSLPAVRTGVRIGHEARKRLRKYSVQPALRRRQPFYPAVGRSPSLLERRLVLYLHESEVQVSSVTPMDSRPAHDGGVYAGSGGRIRWWV